MQYVPDILFVELTRACEYSCSHCRANSITFPEKTDLRIDDLKEIVDEITEINDKIVVVITGGDPLLSPYFSSFMIYLRQRRVRFSLSPPASPILSFEYLQYLSENGLASMSMSLDGTPSTHDLIRNRKGSFRDTLDILNLSREIGIKTQINSTLMKKNMNDFPFILKTILESDIKIWEIFFLINVGRGITERSVSASEFEDFLKFLYGVESNFNLTIRTVEAPEYRRVKENMKEATVISGGKYFSYLREKTKELTGVDISVKGKDLKNGKRFKTLFVSSSGDVMISGLFPLKLGNIRTKRLYDILENSEILNNLSEKERYVGKCSRCEYFDTCGGSRARAFAETGNFLASDPICLYVPQKISVRN